MYPRTKVRRFDFPPGRSVAGKYLIQRQLGSGYEGEVYAIVERATGIRRAAKFYYPHRDPMGKAAIVYARKLDALRHCPILMQYHHQDRAVPQGVELAGIGDGGFAHREIGRAHV